MPYTLEETAGPFWRLDVPAEPYESTITDDATGAAVPLVAGVVVEAGLQAPDGSYAIPVGPVETDAATDEFTLPWGASSPFTVRGIHYLDVRVAGQQVDLMPVVVQQVNGWHTLSSARAEWRDLPSDPAVAFTLLEIAAEQILEFAPALPVDAQPTIAYRKAQLMQARNIWNASAVDPSTGDLGEGGFALTPFPLDWMVKQVVRPKRAIPRVG